MNKNTTIAVIIVLAVLVVAAVLFSGTTPTAKQSGSGSKIDLTAGPVAGLVKSPTLGEYLTDTEGRTLYVFADDKKLESVCTGECLKRWPPFLYDNKDLQAHSDLLSKRMNVIIAKDEAVQYAYGEKPLYYYIGDKNPGEVNGNGLNGGKWSIVLITQ